MSSPAAPLSPQPSAASVPPVPATPPDGSPAPASSRPPAPLGPRLLRLASRFTVQIALLLLVVVFSSLSRDFLTPDNWSNIVQQSAVLAIAACGATFVIIIAGIDLSVGSVMALAGILSAGMVVNHGWPGPLGWAFCLGVGLAVGLFNGLCISFLGLSAFIATLSSLAMARGLTLAYSNGSTIFGLPDDYSALGSGALPLPVALPGGLFANGLPVSVVITALVFVAGHVTLAHSVFGHQVYALGGNREAARLAGVNVRRVELLVYVLAGGLSGLASLVLTGRLTAALPSAANGQELDVIAAVVIGGASLFGGRGTMVGTLFGVLTIGVLRNGLNLLNVSPFWVQFVQGAIIFVAVLLDALGQRQRRASA